MAVAAVSGVITAEAALYQPRFFGSSGLFWMEL
jgi:hypothetical protein